MFSCGRAKTIRIRQRILRKYSEVRKNTHYCVGHGKALDFLSISLRDTVPIMHTREERLFFFPRLTAFVKVNSSQRSICGTSQHYPLCDYWHIRPSKSLSTFLGWLLWISLRPVIPILLSFFLFFFFNRAPPGDLWTSSSSVSFWCPSRCFGPVLVYLRSCLIRSFTLFHLFTRKAIDNIDLN